MQDHSDSLGPQRAPYQTGDSIVNRTSVAAHGAAKVFREFKWGLLTLFLMMVVVISLIYDGGKRKNEKTAQAKSGQAAAVKKKNADHKAGGPQEQEQGLGILDREDQPPGMPAYRSPLDDRIGRAMPHRPDPNRPDPYYGTQQVQQRGSEQGRPLHSNQNQAHPPQVPAGPPTLDPLRQPVQYQHRYGSPAHQDAAARDRFEQRTVTTGVRPGTGYQGGVEANQNGLEQIRQITRQGERPSHLRSAKRTYVVKDGDTLSHIAQQLFPGAVRKGTQQLAEANRHLFSDPRRMRPGMVLNVPETPQAAANTQQAHSPQRQTAQANGTSGSSLQQSIAGLQGARNEVPAGASKPGLLYTVQPGDTLAGIAQKKLNNGRRWVEIFKQNKDVLRDPSHLRVGQQLTLPAQPSAEVPSSSSAKPSKSSTALTPIKRKIMAVQNVEPEAAQAVTDPKDFTPQWMP